MKFGPGKKANCQKIRGVYSSYFQLQSLWDEFITVQAPPPPEVAEDSWNAVAEPSEVGVLRKAFNV